MSGLWRTAIRRWVYPRSPHTLRVRDAAGSYRELSVTYVLHRNDVRVAIAFDGEPPALLPPLQVGWLRAQLRSDVLEADAAPAPDEVER
jgi:hypothetical protein